MRQKHQSVASPMCHHRGQNCNLGMCPDRESNRQPLPLRDDDQPTEKHRSGLFYPFYILFNSTVLLQFCLAFLHLYSWETVFCSFFLTWHCVCFWYQSNTDFKEWIEKYSILFQFLKIFMRVSIILL